MSPALQAVHWSQGRLGVHLMTSFRNEAVLAGARSPPQVAFNMQYLEDEYLRGLGPLDWISLETHTHFWCGVQAGVGSGEGGGAGR